jgi:UDP-glucose 4-epimerase
MKDATTSHILGDATSASRTCTSRCVDAILFAAAQRTDQRVQPRHRRVLRGERLICRSANVSSRLQYAGGERGWVGDNPFIFLDTRRIRALGWKPELSIKEGVVRTVQYLRQNPWVFDAR